MKFMQYLRYYSPNWGLQYLFTLWTNIFTHNYSPDHCNGCNRIYKNNNAIIKKCDRCDRVKICNINRLMDGKYKNMLKLKNIKYNIS